MELLEDSNLHLEHLLLLFGRLEFESDQVLRHQISAFVNLAEAAASDLLRLRTEAFFSAITHSTGIHYLYNHVCTVCVHGRSVDATHLRNIIQLKYIVRYDGYQCLKQRKATHHFPSLLDELSTLQQIVIRLCRHRGDRTAAVRAITTESSVAARSTSTCEGRRHSSQIFLNLPRDATRVKLLRLQD